MPDQGSTPCGSTIFDLRRSTADVFEHDIQVQELDQFVQLDFSLR